MNWINEWRAVRFLNDSYSWVVVLTAWNYNYYYFFPFLMTLMSAISSGVSGSGGWGTMWLAQYKAERKGKVWSEHFFLYFLQFDSNSTPICSPSTQDTHLMAKPLFTRRLTKELKGMWGLFSYGRDGVACTCSARPKLSLNASPWITEMNGDAADDCSGVVRNHDHENTIWDFGNATYRERWNNRCCYG
jgi:hypothetical protein